MGDFAETCDRQIQSISATQQALETTHGEMRDLHNTIATTLQQRDAVSEQMRLLEAKMNVNIHKMHEDLQDEVMKKLEDTIAHAHISEKMVEDRLMYRHLVDMYELNKRNSERMDAQLRTYQEDLLKREARNLEHETENANAIAQLHVEMAELEDQGKRMQQERDNLTARLEKIVKLNCEKALGVLEGVVDVTAEETEPATAEQPPVESVTEIVPNMVPDVVSDVVSDVVDETKFANFPADHCPADTKDTFEDALATMTVTNNDVNESKTVDNSPSVDSMRKQNGSDIEFTNSDKFLLSEADNVSCTSASDGLKKMEDKFQSLENRQTQMLKFFTNIVDKLQQKSNERSATCVPTPEASPTVTQNTTPNGTPHNSNDVRIWLPESFKRNVVEKFGREHIIDDEIVPQKPLSPTKHACEALRISTEQTASPLLPKSASPPPLSPVRSLWQPPTSTETLARQHSVSPMLIPSRSVDSHEQRKIVAPARGRQKMASLRTTKIGRHSSAIGNDHMVTIKKETKCARNIRQRSEMVPVRPSGDSKTARHSQPRSPSIQFNVSGLTSPPATWTSPHSTCPVTRMPPEPTPHSKVPLTVSRIRERVTDCPQTSSSLLGPVPRAAPVPCSPPVPPAYDTPDLELMDGKYMPMKELLDYLQDLQVINDTMQTSTQKVEQQQQPQQQKQPVRLEQRTCGGPDITEMTPISEIGSGSDVQDESEVYDYDNGGEARAKTTNRVAWYERLHSKQRKTNLYTSKNKQTQLSRKAETETGRKSSSWK